MPTRCPFWRRDSIAPPIKKSSVCVAFNSNGLTPDSNSIVKRSKSRWRWIIFIRTTLKFFIITAKSSETSLTSRCNGLSKWHHLRCGGIRLRARLRRAREHTQTPLASITRCWLKTRSADDVAEALSEFEQELKLDPSNADAAYEIGEIHRKAGRFEQAEQFFA